METYSKDFVEIIDPSSNDTEWRFQEGTA